MQFDFGRNWIAYSTFALTDEKVLAARKDFETLFEGIPLRDTSFLDIGFGQGLSLFFAKENGARGFGTDINPKCLQALNLTATAMGTRADMPIIIGSIVDDSVIKQLRLLSDQGRGFDIVHSWGVLHHTGDMKTALRNASSLVAEKGYFVIALYNRHFTSKPWLLIKWFYCKSPGFVKMLFIAALYPVIAFAKFITTRKSPFQQQRGMDFYYNVIDWIGGYPYEYASKEEIVSLMTPRGFTCCKFRASEVPTGCNEFVFRKTGDDQSAQEGCIK